MPLFIFNNKSGADSAPADLQEIVDYIIKSENSETNYLILPTNKWARAEEATLVKSYYKLWNKPSPSFNVSSLLDFIKFIEPELALKVVSDSYQFAVFQESLKNADLKFFSSSKRDIPIQLSKKLFQVIRGLREDGIFSEEVFLDLHSKTEITIEPRRLNDIYEISRAYEAMLGDEALDDFELIRRTFLKYKSAPKLIESKFAFNSKLFFFGFSKFKKPEIDFLSLFSELDISLLINFDYSPIVGPLFSEYEQLTIDLQGAGFERKFVLDKDYDDDVYKLARSKYLRETLFRSDRIRKSDKFNDVLKIYEANDKSQEIKSIVKLTKSLLADKNKNIAPSDICIVSRKADDYASKFRDLFYSANIPAYISDRYALGSSKPALALIALLDLISDDYKQEDFNKILQNDFLDFSSVKNTFIDFRLLDNLAKQYRIFGGVKRMGLENWRAKFNGALRAKLAIIEGAKYEDNMELVKIEKEVKLLQRGLIETAKLKSIFPRYSDMFSPQEFRKFLFDWIIEFDFREEIKKSYQKLVVNKEKITDIEYVYRFEFIEKNAKALTALIKEINSFCDILGKVDKSEKLKFGELAAKFKAALSEAKYQIREKEGYGVSITSFEQIRGIDYPIVIFCGMNEGEFPIPFRADTFVGKELLDSEENHYAAERTLFFQTLINDSAQLDADGGRKKIYLFYSKFGKDKDLSRSQYIDELFRIINIEKNKNFFSLEELEQVSGEENSFVNAIISSSALACEFANNAESETLLKQMQDLKLSSASERIIRGDRFPLSNVSVPESVKDISSISISQLEEYAKCPFMYFANRVLKFGEEEKLEPEITPMEQGSLLHSIACRFYNLLLDNQRNILNVPAALIYGEKRLDLLELDNIDNKEREGYLSLLKSIALEEMEKINNNEIFFEIDKNMILGSAGKTGLLELWLDSELERREKFWNYKPALFEFGFGLDGKRSAVKLSENLNLKGRIDRVDAQIDPATGELAFLICDYKTKRKYESKNDLTKVEEGKAFQTPLYLAAAKQILASEYHISAREDGAYYYSFTPQKANIPKKITGHDKITININVIPALFGETTMFSSGCSQYTINKSGKYNKVIEESIKKADDIVLAISKGSFPVNPAKDACKYCDYKTLCRIEEINKNEIDDDTAESSEN